MVPATSRRLLLVTVPLAWLVIALGSAPATGRTGDDFATPAPRPLVAQAQPTPQTSTEPAGEVQQAGWPRPVALALGSVFLFGTISTVYYRTRMTGRTRTRRTPWRARPTPR